MQPGDPLVKPITRRAQEAAKLLPLRRRKKEPPAMFVEITVNGRNCLRLEELATLQHLGQEEVLRQVLEKGMKSFNSQQLADVVEEYEWLKERFEEYKRDHEVLARLYSQNRELRALLNSAK